MTVTANIGSPEILSVSGWAGTPRALSSADWNLSIGSTPITSAPLGNTSSWLIGSRAPPVIAICLSSMFRDCLSAAVL